MIILSNGLAVKTARPRLSSLLIGKRSPSFGSVYDNTNGTSINLWSRSIRALKCSYVPTSVLGNEIRRNSASNCKNHYKVIVCQHSKSSEPTISSEARIRTLLLISNLAIVGLARSFRVSTSWWRCHSTTAVYRPLKQLVHLKSPVTRCHYYPLWIGENRAYTRRDSRICTRRT